MNKDMFRDLTHFRKTRRSLEAFGFYLAYLGLGLLLAGFAGGVINISNPSDSFMDGYKIGTQYGHFVAVIYCPLLCILILRAKKSYTFISLLLVPISGILVVLSLGMLGGLIPAAFLTTFRDSSTGVNSRNGMTTS
jgi:hypothetical protein